MLEGQLIERNLGTNANGTSGYSRNNASEFQLPVFEFPMCALSLGNKRLRLLFEAAEYALKCYLVARSGETPGLPLYPRRLP
jgi:hypothetical protein